MFKQKLFFFCSGNEEGVLTIHNIDTTNIISLLVYQIEVIG